MSTEYLDQALEVDDRLRFEAMIADLSSTFVNAPSAASTS